MRGKISKKSRKVKKKESARERERVEIIMTFRIRKISRNKTLFSVVLVHFDLYKVPHKAPTDLEIYIGVKDKKYGGKIFRRER